MTPAGLVNLLDCELYLFINLSIYFGEGVLKIIILERDSRVKHISLDIFWNLLDIYLLLIVGTAIYCICFGCLLNLYVA